MDAHCNELMEEKWRLLRGAASPRGWGSLDETRQCVLCERTFTGREVRVIKTRLSQPRLLCPTRGCRASPSQWIHPGNPLVSEAAWQDWKRLLSTLCDKSAHC